MVTPLGLDAASTWRALLDGRVATRSLRDAPEYLPPFIKAGSPKAEKLYQLPCTVAAPVIDDGRFKATGRETRAYRMLMCAADEAILDSGLYTAPTVASDAPTAVRRVAAYEADRVGVCIGACMTAIQDVTEAAAHLYFSGDDSVGYNKVGPFFVPKILGNTAAGGVGIRYGLRGPNACPMTACATGAHSISDAARWIRYGEADAVVCGATEACITPIGIAGFARMKALSAKFNNEPHRASRPFDNARAGFVMGEGAGVLVLEELESAVRRGARIYAEVSGIGASGDAFHVSSPHPDGLGAQNCVARALRDANIDPKDVAYVNAHATGTPMGDEIEAAALVAVLRGDSSGAPPLMTSSTKGALGHLLGAAGAVEAIVAALSLHHGVAPGTANLENPIDHDATRIQLITTATPGGSALPADAKATLSTSFGFGGTNAALLFSKVTAT